MKTGAGGMLSHDESCDCFRAGGCDSANAAGDRLRFDDDIPRLLAQLSSGSDSDDVRSRKAVI